MTIKELINLLEELPNKEGKVNIAIPEDILDDGYINTYRICEIDGIYFLESKNSIRLSYDNRMGEIE